MALVLFAKKLCKQNKWKIVEKYWKCQRKAKILNFIRELKVTKL